MARALWKGSIAFGLVNIAVELHGAVRDHRPRFRLLHAKDESPVRYERVCQSDGKPVAWEDLVKGYEYEKGSFVVLTKDDFKTAALEKTRTIDILDFVDADDIDERYYETPYYILPARNSERAYALLREAIRESGRVGIAKIILRDAQHLACVEVIRDAIVLTMMRFADELVDLASFSFPAATGLRKPEVTMATQLIGHLSASWDPEKYTDEYKENLMRLIKAKLKGKQPTLKGRDVPRQANVVDLMERLKASLDQRGGGGRPAAAKRSPETRTRRPASKSKNARRSARRVA
jgi:DNA end-binding protein Ku